MGKKEGSRKGKEEGGYRRGACRGDQQRVSFFFDFSLLERGDSPLF